MNPNSGLVFVVAGLVGSVLGGIILDKTKKFKTVTIITYILTLAFMAGFTGLLSQASIPLDFSLIAILGFFMTGYLPIGFEFGAEITYPQSEATSSALLNFSVATFGLILTASSQAMWRKRNRGKFFKKIPTLLFITIQALLEGGGDSGDGYDDEKASLYANIVMVGSLLIGTIMTLLTKEVLHRQNAQYTDEKQANGFENKAYDESSGASTGSSMCDGAPTAL